MPAVRAIAGYVFDPDDPRAPSMEQWDAMSAEERRLVVDMLPSYVPPEILASEGDPHRKAKNATVDALDGFFRRTGRKVYLSSELPVFYPNEPRIVPDVIAVLDAEPYERMKWMVADERRGLDFVLEVHVAGDKKKDLERNVETYARLGIPEYFVFDRGRLHINGFRLPSPTARSYRPILPQEGRYPSLVLGLDLMLDGPRLRFLHGGAPLPESEEVITKLGGLLNDVIANKEASERRVDDLEQELAEERRLREDADRLRDEERQQAAQRLAEALAEIERLKRN